MLNRMANAGIQTCAGVPILDLPVVHGRLEWAAEGHMDAEDVGNLVQTVVSPEGDVEEGQLWARLSTLVDRWQDDDVAAWGMAVALRSTHLDQERRLQWARELMEHWSDDVGVMRGLAYSSEMLVDNNLNAAPPHGPLFRTVAQTLERAFDEAETEQRKIEIADALVTVGRVCGRALDTVTEATHRWLVEADAERWSAAFNYGLFLKNRGRFDEGLTWFLRAKELGGAGVQPVEWNLGICATAVGRTDLAAPIWVAMGVVLDGVDEADLPRGRFPPAQVRVAERPVAERTDGPDDPGDEETIWIERTSPCHGIVRSALFSDFGVDYGDVVLFDGAPILTRQWGDQRVPVFPHLTTLRRPGWNIHRFVARQNEAGQVATAGEQLGEGALLYVHDEQFRILCRACYENRCQDHTDTESTTHHIVSGKLVFPPGMPAASVAAAIQQQEQAHDIRIHAPGLWEQLGEPGRADEEARHAQILQDAKQAPGGDRDGNR